MPGTVYNPADNYTLESYRMLMGKTDISVEIKADLADCFRAPEIEIKKYCLERVTEMNQLINKEREETHRIINQQHQETERIISQQHEETKWFVYGEKSQTQRSFFKFIKEFFTRKI